MQHLRFLTTIVISIPSIPIKTHRSLHVLTGEAAKHEAEFVDRRIQRIQQCSRDPWLACVIINQNTFPTCMRCDVMRPKLS